MAVTTTTLPRPSRPRTLWAALAVAGALGVAGVTSVLVGDDGAAPASSGASRTATAGARTPASADATAQWTAGDLVDVRGMSADAAARWLEDHRADGTSDRFGMPATSQQASTDRLTGQAERGR